MRVEKIVVLFVIIQLQIFMTTTATTVVDELKSDNSLALKMIRKLTQDSNVKKVLENLDVNVEKVLERLEKCPDIRLTRVAQTIKWECEEYLENTAEYCKRRPRSDELKGGQCNTCTGWMKLKVAICEIDPIISFCKMIPELPIPEQMHNASEYMKDVLVSDWTYDGTEAIFSQSVWSDSDYRRKEKENLCGVSASRRQDGKHESKNDFGKEDINPKTGDISKDQNALNDELNEL